MIRRTAPPKPPGWWIPWIFVGGFLLVVAVNGVMIWLAAATWTGLVTDRAYDRGLEYNRNLEAAAQMARLGWQTRLSVTALSDGARELRLEARDRAGEPLSGLLVEGRLERPVHAGADRELFLAPAGRGVYRAVLEDLPPGQWHAHLRLTRGSERFVVSERLFVR
ncbi:MAG: FixH family protein [Geminicoccaceae bacterium]|nr:FixH family protein [Geminicoccaceae bacterium]MDW8342180.1 FixH family protein [Geminicoccaceae bacterium]